MFLEVFAAHVQVLFGSQAPVRSTYCNQKLCFYAWLNPYYIKITQTNNADDKILNVVHTFSCCLGWLVEIHLKQTSNFLCIVQVPYRETIQSKEYALNVVLVIKITCKH